MSMPTISLAMIVKNEAANLERCLQSIQGQVDEIVIVDTGSTDDTLAIAHKYTNKVYRFAWEDDFSSARNYALCQCSCNWALILDADEELTITINSLKEIVLSHAQADVIFLPLHCIREDATATSYLVLRLLRNNQKYQFFGKVHEQIRLNEADVIHFVEMPVIKHYPSQKKKRNVKRHRNIKLLQREIGADEPHLSLYLGLEWLGLGKFDRAADELAKAYKHIHTQNKMVAAQIIRNYLTTLRACKQLTEAACICLEKSREYSDYCDLFFDGGLVFEDLGEYEIALKWFRAAVRIGIPPAIYPHTIGAESFLALYHMGRCYEKLLKPREARLYYEKALAIKPQFLHPLSALFQLLQTQYEPVALLRYFREMGYVRYSDNADLIAWHFYIAGYPKYAYEVMGQLTCPDREKRKRVIKYLVYSSCFTEASVLAKRALAYDPEFIFEVGEELVIAAIFQTDYETARRLALQLWCKPVNRSQGWVLLKLCSCMTGRRACFQAEKHRYPEIITALLTIIDDCLKLKRNTAHNEQLQQNVSKVVQLLLTWLQELSAEGARMAAQFWQDKAAEVRQRLDIQCYPVRELYNENR